MWKQNCNCPLESFAARYLSLAVFPTRPKTCLKYYFTLYCYSYRARSTHEDVEQNCNFHLNLLHQASFPSCLPSWTKDLLFAVSLKKKKKRGGRGGGGGGGGRGRRLSGQRSQIHFSVCPEKKSCAPSVCRAGSLLKWTAFSSCGAVQSAVRYPSSNLASSEEPGPLLRSLGDRPVVSNGRISRINIEHTEAIFARTSNSGSDRGVSTLRF